MIAEQQLLFIQLILHGAGVFISIGFWLIDTGRLTGYNQWFGFICKGHICQNALSLSDARLFILPNYQPGMVVFLLTPLLLFFPAFHFIYSIIFGAAALIAMYLFHRLVFVHKLNCTLCFFSHAVVMILFVLSLV